jgi:DNA recombination protein RmuC
MLNSAPEPTYLLALLIVLFALLVWLLITTRALRSRMEILAAQFALSAESHQNTLSQALQQGLSSLAERNQIALLDHSERLRNGLGGELNQLREVIHQLQLAQSSELAGTRESTQFALNALGVSQAAELAQNRETLTTQLNASSAGLKQAQTEFLGQTLQTLAEQGRAQQVVMQNTMQHISAQLTTVIEGLNATVNTRLGEISGKVTERLDEGFKKTNETFVNVMTRLATIDEAQKKIDSLTSNVVTLQSLLGDKRSRGAFGEVQLESLVRNILPPDAYAFQVTLSNGNRVDCLLQLPEPTGNVAIDAKFPLENYHRMMVAGLAESERILHTRAFKADIRKHIDDIASKYLIEGETSDGAVMFVPAEAVFAEIHGNHAELNEYAQLHRVWIVSPTTLMAVLNTARAVIKDVETRRQVHIIKDELSRLGKEFNRFDTRMKKLADHIRQAHEDAADVHTTSQKISRRFSQIEAVDLDTLREAQPLLPDEPVNTD